jgi:hypothetical protein
MEELNISSNLAEKLVGTCKGAINRWTDNTFAVKKVLVKKYGKTSKEVCSYQVEARTASVEVGRVCLAVRYVPEHHTQLRLCGRLKAAFPWLTSFPQSLMVLISRFSHMFS